jgi:hypothetical protein
MGEKQAERVESRFSSVRSVAPGSSLKAALENFNF